LEKKKQKTFAPGCAAHFEWGRVSERAKVFLVLFFKKEHFLPSSLHGNAAIRRP
jgi:hypothetical protein